jgi:hypothetical protein
VLVDASTLDDAGVFAHGRGEVLVQTVDFFPPIVDDPYDFGAIAAANSLSDVYAMGGKPLTALALLCAPDATLAPEVLAAVMQGGLDTMRKAGTSVVGGHTVRDTELKFGYAVTGIAKRKQLLLNSGARAGDRLYLTKPLGTGILSTALKQGKLDARLEKAALRADGDAQPRRVRGGCGGGRARGHRHHRLRFPRPRVTARGRVAGDAGDPAGRSLVPAARAGVLRGRRRTGRARTQSHALRSADRGAGRVRRTDARRALRPADVGRAPRMRGRTEGFRVERALAKRRVPCFPVGRALKRGDHAVVLAGSVA